MIKLMTISFMIAAGYINAQLSLQSIEGNIKQCLQLSGQTDLNHVDARKQCFMDLFKAVFNQNLGKVQKVETEARACQYDLKRSNELLEEATKRVPEHPIITVNLNEVKAFSNDWQELENRLTDLRQYYDAAMETYGFILGEFLRTNHANTTEIESFSARLQTITDKKDQEIARLLQRQREVERKAIRIAQKLGYKYGSAVVLLQDNLTTSSMLLLGTAYPATRDVIAELNKRQES